MNFTSALLIPALPLLSFVLLGFFGKKLSGSNSGWFATICLAASAFLSLSIAYDYFMVYGKNSFGAYKAIEVVKVVWLKFGDRFSIDMGMLLDPISCMMLVVVTMVSLMVHLFSIGYMKGEERFSTYYAYLGLFTFSMLGLVLSVNLFQIYIFWELVGVSSFLLIGFYYDRASAIAAAKKAFIVTRFADLGFLLGILVLSDVSGTLDFSELIARLTDPSSPGLMNASATSFLGASALTWGLVLIFIGGAGKSAMFPLHVWLPDAMEGPTPVSALIHAATMVVAGVYLVARLFGIFALSAPAALDLVAWIGAVSSLFAAIIACTQTDIKRILAYSTMSQIGYMMFALGVSGYAGEDGVGFTAGNFHLFTHAMFKALLFLGAGMVIHAVHSNELKDMGGLRKELPLTHITFLIACLSIAGIPPFSGFFSKEAILHAASETHPAIYWIGLITAALTAFYMFRLYFGVFWNRHSAHHGHHHGPAEGGWTMKLPLAILGIAAVSVGFIPFGRFVNPTGEAIQLHTDLAFSVLPVCLSIGGILLAARMYAKQNQLPETIASRMGALYVAARNRFHIDEIYLFFTKKIIFPVFGAFAAWFDRSIVDGGINTLADAAQVGSESVSGLQSGKVQQYAVWFLFSAIALVVFFIYITN
ncbi:MAG: NADH-quinone oxidoreductase subunit L [Bacteroidota bacterium]